MIWIADEIPWQQWTLLLFGVYVVERFVVHYVMDRLSRRLRRGA